MTCSGLRPRAGVIAIALAMIWPTALPAQSTDAESGDPGATVAAPADQPRIAPFAVVHPTYQPSQAAPPPAVTDDGDSRPQPAQRAAPHARNAPSSVIARESSRRVAPPAVEPSTPAETLLAASVEPAQAEPPLPAPRRPAAPPAGVTLTRIDLLRMLAAAACLAIFLIGAAFALGRRSGRKARFAGPVAKTPTWQAVMPDDLAGIGDAPEASIARIPGKRLRRGGAVELDRPSIVSRM